MIGEVDYSKQQSIHWEVI